MRTLCKKALALCVVFALALTCFVGTLSVSAAEFNATITVAPVTVEQGETSVPVVLAINSAEAGINEALIKVSSTVGSIDAEAILVKDAAGTAYTEEELESLHYYVDYPQETTDLGSFFLSARTIDGVLGGVDSAFIKVVFTVDADIAVADYPVNIDVSGVKAASAAEDVIKFNYEEANISVVAPHVHNVVWTSDKAGNHTSSCDAEGCKDFEAVTEPCADEDANNICDKCGYAFPVEPEHEHHVVWESNDDATHTSKCDAEGCDETFVPATEDCADEDADNACDKCGYDMTPAEPECEHENKTLNSATPAIDANTPGLLDYTCDDCGETEEVDEVVNYHMYYVLSYQGIELESEIKTRLYIPKRYLTLGERDFDLNRGDDMFVTFTKTNKKSGNVNVEIHDFSEVKDESYASSTGPVPCYAFDTTVPSPEMSDSFGTIVYVKYKGQWYSGANYDKSVRAGAMDILASAKDAKLKTLLVDLLNYGAAAQTAFGYNTEDLANALLTPAQLALGTSSDVSSTLISQLDNPWETFSSEYGKIVVTNRDIALQSRIEMQYKFYTGMYTGSKDDLTVHVSFTDTKGNPKSSVLVNKKVATEEQIKEGLYYTVDSDTYCSFNYLGLSSADLRQAVTVTMYYGETKVACDSVYSVQTLAYDSLVANTITPAHSAAVKALINEMIEYGDSSKAYFSPNN